MFCGPVFEGEISRLERSEGRPHLFELRRGTVDLESYNVGNRQRFVEKLAD
jgi:hypothetical protein